MMTRWGSVAAILLLALAVAGCAATPPSEKPVATLTAEETAREWLRTYRMGCDGFRAASLLAPGFRPARPLPQRRTPSPLCQAEIHTENVVIRESQTTAFVLARAADDVFPQSILTLRRAGDDGWKVQRETPVYQPLALATLLDGRALGRRPYCRAGNLRATAGWQGATGSMAGPVTLTNTSKQACILLGPLRVRLEDAAGRTLAFSEPAPAAKQAEQDVLLAPGEKASALLHWSNWCGPRPGGMGLRVILLERLGQLVATAPDDLNGMEGTPRCDAPSSKTLLTLGVLAPVEAVETSSSQVISAHFFDPQDVRWVQASTSPVGMVPRPLFADRTVDRKAIDHLVTLINNAEPFHDDGLGPLLRGREVRLQLFLRDGRSVTVMQAWRCRSEGQTTSCRPEKNRAILFLGENRWVLLASPELQAYITIGYLADMPRVREVVIQPNPVEAGGTLVVRGDGWLAARVHLALEAGGKTYHLGTAAVDHGAYRWEGQPQAILSASGRDLPPGEYILTVTGEPFPDAPYTGGGSRGYPLRITAPAPAPSGG